MTLFRYISLAGLIALQSLPGMALPARQASAISERAEGTWEFLSKIGGGARSEHAVALAGDEIFVLGGIMASSRGQYGSVNLVEIYNIPSQKWSLGAPLSPPQNHVNSIGVDGSLYTVGGLNGTGETWVGVAETKVYTPFNDTWIKLAPPPNGTARGASALGVYGSTILVAGGLPLVEPFFGGIADSTDVVTSYDTKNNVWAELPSLPAPRDHVCGSVVGSTFYVIGGRESGMPNVRDTVYALDLKNGTAWQTLSPMPTPRGGVGCATINGKIYVFGGEGNPDANLGVFPQVEAYDTATDTWVKYRDMRIPRHAMGVVAYDGAAYLPGGSWSPADGNVGIFETFRP
ncbi:kelch repeat-containing protein [Diplocarpon rosae]|nr:kelch repeat-containing protein [Diplocarpon rosae]